MAAQHLSELLPDMSLRVMKSMEPSGQKTLIAAALGYEADATALALGSLMACEGLSTYQALIRASHRHPLLQVRPLFLSASRPEGWEGRGAPLLLFW